MTTLNEAAALAAAERGLAVVSTVRADGTVQASLVNVGLLPHPVSGEPSLGFTTYGKVKLGNLRARPQLAVTFRNGWQWATVEGRAQLVGPDDPRPWLVDGERLRLLLREVCHCGGWHARRLGRVRPGDGAGAARRGADHAHPHLQQRLRDSANGVARATCGVELGWVESGGCDDSSQCAPAASAVAASPAHSGHFFGGRRTSRHGVTHGLVGDADAQAHVHQQTPSRCCVGERSSRILVESSLS